MKGKIFGLFALTLILLGAGFPRGSPSLAAPQARSPVPELLSQVLLEGVASLEKENAAMKGELEALTQELQQAQDNLNLQRAQLANLKAAQVAGDLPLRQAEEALKGFSEGKLQVGARIKVLKERKEQWARQHEERSKALAELRKQVAGLREARHPLWANPLFRRTWEQYQQSGKQYQANAAQLSERREQVLKVLEEQHRLLSEALEDLTRYLEKGWKEELWKRQTWSSLWEMAKETGTFLRTAPERFRSRWEDPLIRQRAGATLKSHWAPILGLLALFLILARLARQGRRLAEARFQAWQQEAPNLGARIIFTAGEILARHLLSLGLGLWAVLLVWVGDWGPSPVAGIVIWAIFVWLVVHLGVHFLQRLFAGPQKGGIFPLDEATAGFYRRHLKVLWVYGWLFGGFFLPVLHRLGLEGPAHEMLGEIIQIGILAYILFLLRRRYFEALRLELPGPGWARRPVFFMTLRVLLLSTLGAVGLSSLLGFHYLSAVIAKFATLLGLALALFWLLWQSALAVLEHFLKTPVHPERERILEGEALLRQYYLSALRVAVAAVVAVAVLLILRLWGVPFNFLPWLAHGLTVGPRLGPFHLSLANLGLAVLVLLLARWLSRFLRTFLEIRFYPHTSWDESLSYTVSSVLHYAILALAIIMALGYLGVSFTDMAIVAGGLGVGIGFGLQNIVNNFISGLILLFERPIKVGDILVIEGQWGTVKEIRVRSTIFQTLERSVLIIPNSELLSSKILNWTHYGSGVNRLALKVGVAYNSDVRKVTKILEEVCRANPRVLKDPPPQIFFEAYGDSSLNFTIWVHLPSPMDRIPVTHELNSAIFEAFRLHGIEIPFPQREVHIKTWPGPLPGKGANPS